MADQPSKDPQFKGDAPEDKELHSGDRSGQGRPRRDDHVLPEGGGRSKFGTHGGPEKPGTPGGGRRSGPA